MSPRTLGRLFQRDIGMAFGKWRQQLHIQVALRELERGATVSMIAYDLGYESPSAFITMFKRNTGETPGALHRANPDT
jgi:AraC-like DNA-binding protein